MDATFALRRPNVIEVGVLGWSPIVAFAGAALAGAALVAMMRRIARRRAWLDIPSARSSHSRPTPTAGGIGMVLPFLLTLALLPQALPAGMLLTCVAAIAAVAAVGLMDDLVGLEPAPRLAIHVVAGLAIAGSAGAAVSGASGWAAAAAVAGWAFVVVGSINVVNFMDGIDGLIGTTALVYSLFAAFAIGPDDPFAGGALVLAGAALGFLAFNRPPASIFMGDVGSGALGAAFIVLGLLTIEARGWSIFHAFLPLAPLVLDEILTLARRLVRGENVLRAHRSHVYQLLVAAGWSHGRVTAMYGAASAILGAAALGAPEPSPLFFVLAAALVAAATAGLVLLRRHALGAVSEKGAQKPHP
jgi:Fuc2NAc and GlcNAc transferase